MENTVKLEPPEPDDLLDGLDDLYSSNHPFQIKQERHENSELTVPSDDQVAQGVETTANKLNRDMDLHEAETTPKDDTTSMDVEESPGYPYCTTKTNGSNTKSSMRQAIQGSFHCQTCYKDFGSLDDFNSHARPGPIRSFYRCDLCKKYLKSRELSLKHIQTHSQPLSSTQTFSVINIKTERHGQETRYFCDKCKHCTFVNFMWLLSHLNNLHSDVSHTHKVQPDVFYYNENSREMKCPFCIVLRFSPDNFDRHLRSAHSDMESTAAFQCGTCRIFLDPLSLPSHGEIHEDAYFVSWEIPQRDGLKSCIMCENGSQNSTLSDLIHHMNQFHRDCMKINNSEDDGQPNIKIFAIASSVDGNSVAQTEFAHPGETSQQQQSGIAFSSATMEQDKTSNPSLRMNDQSLNLQEHNYSKIHPWIFLNCDMCTKQFRHTPNQTLTFCCTAWEERYDHLPVENPCHLQSRELTVEEIVHNEEIWYQYQCCVCGEYFCTRECLLAHSENLNQCQKLSVSESKPFSDVVTQLSKCFICDVLFCSWRRMINHVEDFHFKEPNLQVLLDKVFQCKLCQWHFRLKNLISHMNSHSGKSDGVSVFNPRKDNEMFHCPYCDKCHCELQTVINHINRSHVLQENFLFTCCDLTYYDKEKLVNHIYQSHEICGLFHCSCCDDSFSQVENLVDHISVSHVDYCMLESLNEDVL